MDRARLLYQRTQYRDALEAIGRANDAESWLLTGKAWFGLGEFKKARDAFESAGSSSEALHWLGKAYGRMAESASFVTAPGLASKCRQAFEKAVATNPRNLEALNDLLEYSLEAPGFLGGGMDKAEALAAKIRDLDPIEHEFARARIAEKKKDWADAERRYRKAAETAASNQGRWIDLARFLARQGRLADSDAAFERAAKIDSAAPKLLYARAETMIEAKRDLPAARTLLERYLKAPLTPDDPPRADAEKLLKKASR